MVKRLLYLNGLATLIVVTNHALAWGYVAMFWWPHRYRAVTSPNFDQLYSLTYYVMRGVEQLIIVGIPAFIFVSGFFVAFAAGREGTVTRKFIFTRLRYLVIPYVLWSVIMLLAEWVQGTRYTLLEYLRMLALGQATPAFYFVPLLCQFYLLSPWLAPLAKRHARGLLLGVALLQVLVQLIRYATLLNLPLPGGAALGLLTQGWFFPGNLFWFVLGIAIGFHHAALKAWLQRWRWVFLGGGLLFLVIGIWEWEMLLRLSGQTWLTPKETLVDNLYAALMLLSFLSFERPAYPLAKPISDLGGKSFGVYLVHSLVLTYLARGIYHLAPGLLAWQVVYQPLLIAGGLAIPLLLMTLVKNSPARRTYAYQFG
jgi:membrane-bound acyltransferase YfiQ involved in biofilm formation